MKPAWFSKGFGLVPTLGVVNTLWRCLPFRYRRWKPGVGLVQWWVMVVSFDEGTYCVHNYTYL